MLTCTVSLLSILLAYCGVRCNCVPGNASGKLGHYRPPPYMINSEKKLTLLPDVSGMYGDLRSVTVRTSNLMHILCSLLCFCSLVSMASVCLVDPWARQWVPHWLGGFTRSLG